MYQKSGNPLYPYSSDEALAGCLSDPGWLAKQTELSPNDESSIGNSELDYGVQNSGRMIIGSGWEQLWSARWSPIRHCGLWPLVADLSLEFGHYWLPLRQS